MTCQRVLLWGVFLSVLAVPALAAQEAPDCAAWNTREYFETATVENVTSCLAAGADPMVRVNGGNTPLHFAVYNNENPAVIEALLAVGADPMALADDAQTFLHRAVYYNENPAAVEVLVAAGADPNERTIDGSTLLHRVAEFNGNPAVAEALLAGGADPNERNKRGETPLHEAAVYGRLGVMEALLAVGADPTARDDSGYMPLHGGALYNDNPAVVQALLAAAADVNARDQRGGTPLHRAASNPLMIGFLLAAGANLEARDVEGHTPLHAAADNPVAEAIRALLLSAGANLEARDEDGNTSLHLAAQYVNEYVIGNHAGAAIEALLDAGADATARNAAGQTPWDLAEDNEALKGADAYWRLNDARFETPGGPARGTPTRHQPLCPPPCCWGHGHHGGRGIVPDSGLSDPSRWCGEPGFFMVSGEHGHPASFICPPGCGGAVCNGYGQLVHAGANPGETPGNQRSVQHSGCLAVARYSDVSMPGWPQAITHAPDRWPGLEGLREAISGRRVAS